MRNKTQQLQKLKNERGLTLVELLAVIVILGIISTIAFVMISGVIDNAKKDAQIANAQQLIASAKLYEATGGDIETSGVLASKLHTDGFIETIIDPWTKVTVDMADSKVTKTVATGTVDAVYSVIIKAGSGTGAKGITATEVQLRDKDVARGLVQ